LHGGFCAAGLVDLSAAVAAGRVSVEGREVELKKINAALKKMRAYARDMEVHSFKCTPRICNVRCLLLCLQSAAITRRTA